MLSLVYSSHYCFRDEISKELKWVSYNLFVANAHSGLVITLQSHGDGEENVEHEFIMS